MDIKRKIILCINARNRSTKKKLSQIYGVNESVIKSSVRWFNDISVNRIKHDKKGYYIKEKLTNDEIMFLDGYSPQEKYLEITYYYIYSSLFSKINVKQYFEYNKQTYYKKTLNTHLKFLGLDEIDKIISKKTVEKVYYLSIIPLYFPNDQFELNSNYIKIIEDKSNLPFDEILKFVHEHLEISLKPFSKTIISTHSMICLKSAFIFSYLLKGKLYEEKNFYKHSVFEHECYLPSYMDKELFNTIIILESDISEKINLYKDLSNIVQVFDIFINHDFLDIHFGYITPRLELLPFYNPYIFYILTGVKSSNSDFIKKKIIYIIISKWILNRNIFINHYIDEKYTNTDEYKLLYSSKYHKSNIYIKFSQDCIITSYDNDIFYTFNNYNNFNLLCETNFMNNIKLQSFNDFKICILNRVPKFMYSDVLKALSINFPNLLIEYINFNDIYVNDDILYTVLRTNIFYNLPDMDNNFNFDFNDFNIK